MDICFFRRRMFWFIFIVTIWYHSTSATTDDPMEKFKLCAKEECLLMQCYFPVVEFLNATRNQLQPFQNFIERQHVFVSYHLCDELMANSMDEVGACIYGVLFKLFQFDTNSTLHQRVHTRIAQVQEESSSVVIDMISTVLYRIKSINNSDELRDLVKKPTGDESVVIVNAQKLTSRTHLDVSRVILNYGQWFNFVYSIAGNDKQASCLYAIYSPDNDFTSPKCAIRDDIRMELERRIAIKQIRSNSITSIYDLTHVNVFKRTVSTLFYLHDGSTVVPRTPNENMIFLPIDISKFDAKDVEQNGFLQDPYPFYLFLSTKTEQFQRLGDEPSVALIDTLLRNDREQKIINEYGMFDDEVRHLADGIGEIETHSCVIHLQNQDDYHRFRQEYPKRAILFTVKWDVTSILARQSFYRIAPSMIDHLPMINIDCFDWTNVCNEEKIIEWPTLILMENETNSTIYRGSTDENEMVLALFRFAVNQPFQIDDNDQASVEHLLTRQRVLVLARIQNRDEVLYDVYKTLVDEFSKNEHVFFMYQFSTASSSIIIKQKDAALLNASQLETTIYPLTEDFNHLRTLITDALRTPLVSFDPLDFLKSSQSTFVAASRSQLVQLNDYISSESSADPLVWIDTNSPWVLAINQYGPIAYPALLHIDFSNGYVYVLSNWSDIPSWFESIRMGSMTPFYKLSSTENNDGPSQSEIDFIKQMNDEQLAAEYRMFQEETKKYNEHGLGFDADGVPLEKKF